MYRVFRAIPVAVREAAYRELIERGYGQRNPTTGILKTSVDIPAEGTTCPLGMVNRLLPESGYQVPMTIKVGTRHLDGRERYVPRVMPSHGYDEQDILNLAGIHIDSTDAQDFINDNDHAKFDSPKKLATAMGVSYKGE